MLITLNRKDNLLAFLFKNTYYIYIRLNHRYIKQISQSNRSSFLIHPSYLFFRPGSAGGASTGIVEGSLLVLNATWRWRSPMSFGECINLVLEDLRTPRIEYNVRLWVGILRALLKQNCSVCVSV